MVQVPVAIAVTVLPLTVQVDGVMLLKVTGRPEEADAETVATPPTVIVAGEKPIAPMAWATLVFTFVPVKVPPFPEEMSIQVPEIIPVAGLIMPLHVDLDFWEDATVHNKAPAADIWPLPVPAVSPPEFAAEVSVQISAIAPVEEIVAAHVPLSPPPPINVPV